MKMTKKVLSVLLSVLLVLGAIAAGGMSVSAADTVLISRYNDLVSFANRVNNGENALSAMLAQDIVVSGDIPISPIGNRGGYSGTFDGNYHTITGLQMVNEYSDYQGLFSVINPGGTVKNLGLKGGKITGREYAGGIAAYNNGTISSCFNMNEVSATYGIAGGIAGENGGYIVNCYNTGKVSSEYSSAGIASKNNGSIYYCYNAGLITGDNASGIARTGGNSVRYCYYDTETSGCSGAIGSSDTDYAKGLMGFEMKGPGALNNLSGFSSSDWKTTAGYPVLILQQPDVTVKIDFGTGHETFVQSVFGGDSAFTLNGAVVSLAAYSHMCIGDVAGQVFEAVYEKDIFNDGGEKLMPGLGCTPLSAYTSESDLSEERSIGVTNNMVLYALWQQPAEVNVTVEVPAIGTEIIFVNDYNAGGGNASPTSSPAPEITVEGNAALFRSPYHDNTDGFWCDNAQGEWQYGYPYSGFFTGTVEEGGKYYACFTLTPDFGYFVDETTADHITVNGGVPIVIVGDSATVTAEITATTPVTVEISDYSELKAFAAMVNGGERNINAVLTADIDASASNPESEGFDSANAWTPIGNPDNRYTGTFDGSGHIISGLVFSNTAADYAGLFGAVGNGGTVKNTGLEGGRITGNDYTGGLAGKNQGTIANCYNSGAVSGYDYVGSLAGHNDGTVTNCYSTGSVSCNSYAGGVVGNNFGTITNCCNKGDVSGNITAGGVTGNSTGGTIENCYNTGNVSGIYIVGGVAGYINGGGKVTGCYNTGAASATGNDAGGVAAQNEGTVTNCYNTGSVSGLDNVGGVIGDNENGTVATCYSAGEVTATENDAAAGGVIGYNYIRNNPVNNCFYDSDKTGGLPATGYETGGTSTNVSGLTTDMMTGIGALQNLSGFSADTWLVKENDSNNKFYPHLTGFNFDLNGDQLAADDIPAESWPAKSSGESGAGASSAPQLRINDETNEWEVSYDDGATWESLGVKATGEDGVGIAGISINGNGELIITLTDGSEFNLGKIKGENGADGQNGQDGQNGADGQDGQDGKTPLLRINTETNEWEVSYDDGATWTSLGVKATGENGQNGTDGQNGQDGQNGADGQDGKDGQDAPVITGVYFNGAGELIVCMSDGTEFNAGRPSGGTQPAVKPAVSISGYQNERDISYGATITFHAQVSGDDGTGEIQWFVNGDYKGTGSDFTVENAKDSFNVSVRLSKGGSYVAESGTEKVTVKNGFFSRIIAFIKKLIVPAAFIIDQR